MAFEKGLPPHELAAEEAVIGSALIDEEVIDKIALIVRAEDFYGEKNRICYEGMLALSDRNEPINQVSLSHELSRRDVLADIGGAAYLAHLVMIVPTSAGGESYARIVADMALLRRVSAAGEAIAELGYRGTLSGAGALSRAEETLAGLRAVSDGNGFIPMREIMDAYLQESARVDDGVIDAGSRVPTGFAGLDDLLGGGVARSDMAVIAARPSLGKSAFAFNAARFAAGLGYCAGVFSLEMSREQIGMRILSAECDVEAHRLRSGLMSEQEATGLMDAVGVVSELPFYVDDSATQTVAEMRAKARRLQSEIGLDLLVVDYIQLINGGSRRRENRAVEISEVSRGVKALARELNCAAIVCSQLSRAIEQRPNHRPMLSDLRESGGIEQDADVVAFIHREDVYATKEEWERKTPTEPYPENMAEIIVAKHRNGPVGSIMLHFRKDLARFENLGV